MLVPSDQANYFQCEACQKLAKLRRKEKKVPRLTVADGSKAIRRVGCASPRNRNKPQPAIQQTNKQTAPATGARGWGVCRAVGLFSQRLRLCCVVLPTTHTAACRVPDHSRFVLQLGTAPALFGARVLAAPNPSKSAASQTCSARRDTPVPIGRAGLGSLAYLSLSLTVLCRDATA